jgi:7-cyano-7-deazaguanine reductase
MTTKKSKLSQDYKNLDKKLSIKMQKESAIKPDLLMTFPYKYKDQLAEITIDTEEFSALCPWTGLPDIGVLSIDYLPNKSCLELKSLKYYLLSFRQVGIVQEHAACRILNDLVAAVKPKSMTVTLDYNPRGGLHTTVSVSYPE